MIYNLRKKFILISGVSIFCVLFGIFVMMFVMSHVQLNGTMDALTEAIAENGGVFSERFQPGPAPPSRRHTYGNVITEETAHSIRFFTVWLGGDREILRVNRDSIFSISESQAQEYAGDALETGKEKGWVSDYRFKVFPSDGGMGIVFVNGEMPRLMVSRFLFTTVLILLVSGLAVLILIILISKRVVRPAAESYEKQKQFITDANHELKTPLTLILSDLDIVESEVGKNEWIDDMRSEGERMRLLVNQLVMLSRMDEDSSNLCMALFDLSSAVLDTASEFQLLAADRQKELLTEIEPLIEYHGDEGLIRRLIAILLDNAVKYCDRGGKIKISLYRKRHPTITVENTYDNVKKLELERLFDRFYRADPSRTFDGSFGVGLSIARAIVKNHQGNILAYKKEKLIGFKVELK
ncbi:MAG: HAMP domain-containing histidine kinase [Lachnospiraceae bacterium]|nr:HAMP domain-containing histidine kinase [Lachnospiraceae bacterium]